MIKFLAKDVFAGVLARANVSRLRGQVAFPLHWHDFPEVFWVSEGTGMHRVNQREHALGPGSLVWIRAADEHSFGSDDRGMVLHNVSFMPTWFAGFRRRHFEGDKTFWSGTSAMPEHRRLAAPQVERLAVEFDELGRSGGDGRASERFLLNVLHVCEPEPLSVSRRALEKPEPTWMEPALRAWADPGQWAGGTRSLAKLAGRSEEHVARAVRAATGRSPTDILNSHRIKHAAHLIAATDRKMVDVAAECGFASLGHFYAMFHRHHGCAPALYRKRQPPRPL